MEKQVEYPECSVYLERISTTPEAIEKLQILEILNDNGESEEEEEVDTDEEEEDVGRRTKRRRVSSSEEGEKGEEGAGPSRKLRRRKPQKKGGKPFELLLEGVTFVLSGFVNPERAELREKGLELGAEFEAEWNDECTHLVCAVIDTPKYKEVSDSNKEEGKDAKIVKSSWILDCHKKKRRLPWRRYCLNTDEEGPSSEEEVCAKREQSDSEFSQESEPENEEKDPEFGRRINRKQSSSSDEDGFTGKKFKKRKHISPERISSRQIKAYNEPNYYEDSPDSAEDYINEEEEDYQEKLRKRPNAPKKDTKVPKEKKVVPRNNVYCQRCKDISQDEMLACESCPYSYHGYCLIPKIKDINLEATVEWRCPRCSTPEFEHKLEEILSWRWKEEQEERGERMREFFIKWKNLSFWECSWVDHTPLDVHYKKRLEGYLGKVDMEFPPNFEDDDEYVRLFLKKGKHQNEESKDELNRHSRFYRYGVRPEWLQIHRIIQHKSIFGKVEYLIRWKDIPCDGATWMREENEYKIPEFETHIEIYKEYRFALTGEGDFDEDDPNFKHFNPPPHKASTSLKVQYKEQPSYINENLSIHPYQLSGLNWLRHSYTQGTNTILADEMGLGKTIQAITFLYSLYKEGHSNGPFLVSAPLSTILNWEREFEIWAPDFYVVTYCGKKEAREYTRKYEMTMRGDNLKKKGRRKFHVLLTSYEYVSKDRAFLSGIKWAMLVVDEAQRLKSQKSLFFQVLSAYKIGYRLLLTGTPLQNNLEELFNLLHFLSPEKFNDLEEFQEKFADITKEEQVRQLHDMLGPRILRRMKSDVFKDLPSKSELIVRVELSPIQKKCYKDIITRNFAALNSTNGGYFTSLMNIFMDLRKCCNHPYLFSAFETDAPKRDGGYELSALVQASGKLILLQKMLHKLKEGGHRVLIFSQMTRMLNILEDFLDAEGHRFERIDGSIGGRDRQEAIDRFNSPGAEQFIFLLSTRAGGLGINLATADTVIIFDSDWNPHNDIQALSRAHRIGQVKKVMIYRFVTRATAEERIAQVAKKKLMLEQLVVRAQSFTKTEIDDVLKFGTRELFEESDDKKEVIHYTEEAIAKLLDRNQESTDPDSEQKENWANDYLSSFKVASYATVENNLNTSTSTATLSKEDPFYWNKLMKVTGTQVEDVKKKNEANLPIILGKRVRKAVVYSDDKKKKEDNSLPKGSKSRPNRQEEVTYGLSSDSSGDEEEKEAVHDKDDPDVNLDQLKDSESELSDAEEEGQTQEADIPPDEAEVQERLLKYWTTEETLPDFSMVNDGQVSGQSRCTLCNSVITRIGSQRPHALMNHMKFKHKPEYYLIKGIKERKLMPRGFNPTPIKYSLGLPDLTLPYFDVIRRRQDRAITCRICGEVRKGTHGTRGRDFRIKHLALLHPDKYKKMEDTRLEILQHKANVQAAASSGSAIPINPVFQSQMLQNIAAVRDKPYYRPQIPPPQTQTLAVSNSSTRSFQRRDLQPHDNYITIFRYLEDVNKNQCEICGFFVKGKSVVKQRKHFSKNHNDFLIPSAIAILNGGDEDSSSGMSDLGVIKPEREVQERRNRRADKANRLHPNPQLPDRIAASFSYLPHEDSSVCHLCGTKVPGNGRVNRRKHFNAKHKLIQTPTNGEIVELSSESDGEEEFGINPIKNALSSEEEEKEEEEERPLKARGPRGPYKKTKNIIVFPQTVKKPTQSNNFLSVFRPLLANDDPNSTFTYIKKKDTSQCQLCGQKVRGDGRRNRRKHFNTKHKQQRDQLQILNGGKQVIELDSSEEDEEEETNSKGLRTRKQELKIEKVQEGEEESEDGELGIVPNKFKAEDSDSDVVEVSDDSDEEDSPLVEKRAPTYIKKEKPVFKGREVTRHDTFLSVYTPDGGINGSHCQLCGKTVKGLNSKSMKNRINHIQKNHPAAYNLIMEANDEEVEEEEEEEVLQEILEISD